jgi:large subunit ribosomal protein L22
MKRMSTNITNGQAASHAHAHAPAVPHHKGDLLYDRATNPLFVTFEGLDGAKKEYPLYTIPTGTKKRNVKNQPVRTRIKPGMIRKRLEKMRTFEGSEKAIRHSPWRMNLVCQLAAQQPTVVDSLLQMEFCIKKRAPPIVETVIRRTCNLADIQHGLQPCQLEVAECFATQGTHLKRIKFMGRGRTGTKHRKFTHMRLVLREIDFPLKIALSRTVSQKKKWILRQQIAEQEAAVARQERQEMKQLEALAKERNDLKEASSKNKS